MERRSRDSRHRLRQSGEMLSSCGGGHRISGLSGGSDGGSLLLLLVMGSSQEIRSKLKEIVNVGIVCANCCTKILICSFKRYFRFSHHVLFAFVPT